MEGISKNEEILDRMRLLRSRAYEKDDMSIHDRIVEKAEELKKKYGKDCYNYESYHLLVGSTLDGPVSNLDFPGEDSVEEFLKSL